MESGIWWDIAPNARKCRADADESVCNDVVISEKSGEREWKSGLFAV